MEPATRIVIAEPADVEPKLLGYHGTISSIRNNLDGTPPSRRQWLSPSPVSEVYSGSPKPNVMHDCADAWPRDR